MDQIIKIRVTADDKALFEAKAAQAGLTLSAWARQSLRKADSGVSWSDLEKIIDPEVLKIIRKE